MSNGNHMIDLDYSDGPKGEIDWDAGADEQVDAILQAELEEDLAIARNSAANWFTIAPTYRTKERLATHIHAAIEEALRKPRGWR